MKLLEAFNDIDMSADTKIEQMSTEQFENLLKGQNVNPVEILQGLAKWYAAIYAIAQVIKIFTKKKADDKIDAFVDKLKILQLFN